MDFGEVLGFASAMFPRVGQWPHSSYQIPAACVASGPTVHLLSPVQQQQQPGKVTLWSGRVR